MVPMGANTIYWIAQKTIHELNVEENGVSWLAVHSIWVLLHAFKENVT